MKPLKSQWLILRITHVGSWLWLQELITVVVAGKPISFALKSSSPVFCLVALLSETTEKESICKSGLTSQFQLNRV